MVKTTKLSYNRLLYNIDYINVAFLLNVLNNTSLIFFGNYKDKYVRSYKTKITNYIKESSVLVVRDSCNKVFQLKVIHKMNG